MGQQASINIFTEMGLFLMFGKIKFRTLAVLVLIASFAIYAQVNDLMPYPVEEFTADTAYRVIKVESTSKIEIEYDGKPTNVILLGVDTSSAGYHATEDFLRDLLVGEWVYLRFGEEKKSRMLVNTLQAYIYRAPDGLFVNLELIRLGYGQVRQHSGKQMALFQYYGDRARSEGKGIWYKPKTVKTKKLWD